MSCAYLHRAGSQGTGHQQEGSLDQQEGSQPLQVLGIHLVQGDMHHQRGEGTHHQRGEGKHHQRGGSLQAAWGQVTPDNALHLGINRD